MEAGHRTPLLDMFRRGEVTSEIKMLAARGALAPRPHEQLMLLMALVDDPDADVRRAAAETLGAIPVEALQAYLARSDVSATLKDFFAKRGIGPGEVPAPDGETPLVDPEGDAGPLVDDGSLGEAGGEKVGAVQRLSLMTVAERMKAGMKGTREERSILIRDPNKLVSSAVLSSPKVNEAEIESFAKMANVSEEVLRVIGNTRAWMKNYNVVSALARNPKTPPAVSLHLVQRLNDRDLKMISLDRNAPEPLKRAVRTRLTKSKHG
jgi:hypothetical protein